MATDRSPTEITDEGHYWLRAQRVTGYPRIARDSYFPKHDVTRPAAVTADDLPPTDDDAVRRLDREALEIKYTSGKWQVTLSAEALEDHWPAIVDDVSAEIIWDAKAMTATGREEIPYDDYMIVVYTPNYFDRADVDRVRQHLRDAHGVNHEIAYKPDIYTNRGIIDENAAEWGLSNAARYRE